MEIIIIKKKGEVIKSGTKPQLVVKKEHTGTQCTPFKQ